MKKNLVLAVLGISILFLLAGGVIAQSLETFDLVSDEGTFTVKITKDSEPGSVFLLKLKQLFANKFVISFDRTTWTLGETVRGQDSFPVEACSNVKVDFVITRVSNSQIVSQGTKDIGGVYGSSASYNIAISTSSGYSVGEYRLIVTWKCGNTNLNWPGSPNPDYESFTLISSPTPPSCNNECNLNGATACSGNGYRTCGNYDSDSCLEWGSVLSCGGTGYICLYNSCTYDQCSPTSNKPQGCQCSSSSQCSSGNVCTNGICSPQTSCTPNWQCFDFGPCQSNGVQSRTCADANNCGTNSGRPSETQSCVYTGPPTDSTGNPDTWVSSPSECFASKPIGCADKSCVAEATQCGTCAWSCPYAGARSCVNGKVNICTVQNSNCGSNVATTESCTGEGLIQEELGTSPVGVSCESNKDCDSGFCDVDGWFNKVLNLAVNRKTCQPTPWYLAKKVAIPREDIDSLTTQDQVSIACLSNDQCIPPSGDYKAKCIPLVDLKKDGTISNTAGFFSEAKGTIDRATNGVLVGGGLGALACVGGITATVILAPTVAGSVITGTATASACTALIAGGAVVGGVKSITVSEKDPLVIALKASDEQSVGLCVADTSSSFDISAFLDKAAIIKITGDPTVDGAIVIFGALFLLALLFRIGGSK